MRGSLSLKDNQRDLALIALEDLLDADWRDSPGEAKAIESLRDRFLGAEGKIELSEEEQAILFAALTTWKIFNKEN